MSKKIIIPITFILIILSIIFVLVFTKSKNNSLPSIPLNQNPCIVSGCSGQLCVNQNDEPIVSTCEWTDQYACYKQAECKLQSNNQCGFTPTAELNNCLNSFSKLDKPTY